MVFSINTDLENKITGGTATNNGHTGLSDDLKLVCVKGLHRKQVTSRKNERINVKNPLKLRLGSARPPKFKLKVLKHY